MRNLAGEKRYLSLDIFMLAILVLGLILLGFTIRKETIPQDSLAKQVSDTIVCPQGTNPTLVCRDSRGRAKGQCDWQCVPEPTATPAPTGEAISPEPTVCPEVICPLNCVELVLDGCTTCNCPRFSQ